MSGIDTTAAREFCDRSYTYTGSEVSNMVHRLADEIDRLRAALAAQQHDVAAERERCAKLCEEWAGVRLAEHGGLALMNAAEAIRRAAPQQAEQPKDTPK